MTAEERSIRGDFIGDMPREWPLSLKNEVFAFFELDAERLEGRDRYGELAFTEVPGVLRRIRSNIQDLALEDWNSLPLSITGGGLESQLEKATKLLKRISQFSLTNESFAQIRDQLQDGLAEIDDWFKANVRPQLVESRVQTALGQTNEFMSMREEAERLSSLVANLRMKTEEVSRELASQNDLVSAQRQEVGGKVAVELEAIYLERANNQASESTKWRNSLLAAIGAAIAVASLLFIFLPTDGEIDAKDISSLSFGVFVLGLMVYVVRVCGQQYRSMRHLEAVSNSRAAAVGTFRGLFASVEEPEVRASIAASVAQAVFSLEETGLSDSSGEQVTFVERAVLPRIGPS